MLIAQRGHNLSQFAKSIGIDRSALSQFLASDSTRLPRAETLCTIAAECNISL
ncbi:MAG: helix-turn-helix transcriptional regulator, partial [Alphaproteobacteria bacterium]|nr:helix-turn-helix transcriptional regulator [Alphaproteobacteria bacterium]